MNVILKDLHAMVAQKNLVFILLDKLKRQRNSARRLLKMRESSLSLLLQNNRTQNQ